MTYIVAARTLAAGRSLTSVGLDDMTLTELRLTTVRHLRVAEALAESPRMSAAERSYWARHAARLAENLTAGDALNKVRAT